MENTNNTNELAIQEFTQKVNNHGLTTQQQSALVDNLSSFYVQALEWKEKAFAFVITDENDVEKIKEAKVARIAVKNIRTSIENKRKELKENSLKEGRAIDDIAGFLKSIVEPIENHLIEQENFAETKRKEREKQIIEDRTKLLVAIEADPTFYDLAGMPDEVFLKLVEDLTGAYEYKKIKAQKEEEQRVLQERYNKRLKEIQIYTYVRSENTFCKIGGTNVEISDDKIANLTDEQFNSFVQDLGTAIEHRIKTHKLRKSELLLYWKFLPENIKQFDDFSNIEQLQYEQVLNSAKAAHEEELVRVENENKRKHELFSARSTQLLNLGMLFDAVKMEFTYQKISSIKMASLYDESEEVWGERIKILSSAIEEIIEANNQEIAKQEKFNNRKKALFEIGFSLNGNVMSLGECQCTIDVIQNCDDESYKKLFQQFKDYSISYKELQEAEAKRKDEERKAEEENAKSDKQKFNELLDKLAALKEIKFKSKKHTTLKTSVDGLIDKIVEYAKPKI